MGCAPVGAVGQKDLSIRYQNVRKLAIGRIGDRADFFEGQSSKFGEIPGTELKNQLEQRRKQLYTLTQKNQKYQFPKGAV
jgi:hypothetical protein